MSENKEQKDKHKMIACLLWTVILHKERFLGTFGRFMSK